jgi:hypothetical protein
MMTLLITIAMAVWSNLSEARVLRPPNLRGLQNKYFNGLREKGKIDF